MKRIEYRVVAGFLTAAIGFASLGVAGAADTNDNTGQVPPKSPAAAAPSIARVIVTPSPEQMARIRLEARMIGRENRATVGPQATGAL